MTYFFTSNHEWYVLLWGAAVHAPVGSMPVNNTALDDSSVFG